MVGVVDGVAVLDGSFPSWLSAVYTLMLLFVMWGLPVEAVTVVDERQGWSLPSALQPQGLAISSLG